MKLTKSGVGWLLAGLTAAVNLVSAFFLPDKLAIQVSFGMAVSETASKFAYLPIMAALGIVLAYMISQGGKKEKNRWLVTQALLFGVNLLVVILNLTVFR